MNIPLNTSKAQRVVVYNGPVFPTDQILGLNYDAEVTIWSVIMMAGRVKVENNKKKDRYDT